MDNNFENQTQNPYTEEQYNQNPYNQNPYAQNTQAGREFYPPSYNPFAFLSEEEKEKRAIKKKMTGVGTAFIVLFAIMQFWFIPFSIIAAFSGFSPFDVNSFLQNEYFSYATHVLFSSACFTIRLKRQKKVPHCHFSCSVWRCVRFQTCFQALQTHF